MRDKKEEITGNCSKCRIIFTTKQVDDRCPICGNKLRGDDMENKKVTGTVTEVMEKKNKMGELFWKAKIDNKIFNFNDKPETDTNIEAEYTENTWDGPDGPTTSRWVRGFKVIEAEQQTFQKGSEVKQNTDLKDVMRQALIDAVVVCNDLNELAQENEAPQIKWTGEDIQKIGVTLFLSRTR